MASLTAIKEALADQLSTQLDIPALPYFPDTVNPPVIAIMSASPAAKFGMTMGETPAAQWAAAQVMGESDIIEADDYYLSVCAVIVRTSGGSLQTAQQTLDVLVAGARNSGSIAGAISMDTTLGGLVGYCIPVQVSSYGQIVWAGVEYFGARVAVQVGA